MNQQNFIVKDFEIFFEAPSAEIRKALFAPLPSFCLEDDFFLPSKSFEDEGAIGPQVQQGGQEPSQDESGESSDEDPIEPGETQSHTQSTPHLPRKGHNYVRSFVRKMIQLFNSEKSLLIQPISKSSKILGDKRTILVILRSLELGTKNSFMEKLVQRTKSLSSSPSSQNSSLEKESMLASALCDFEAPDFSDDTKIEGIMRTIQTVAQKRKSRKLLSKYRRDEFLNFEQTFY